MGGYSVLLVEDDDNTRGRLAQVIASHPGLELAETAKSVAEARHYLQGSEPDVLLCDLGLPDGSGIELIEMIRAMDYRTEAMVITVFGDERHVVRAIEAGATGYLLKDGRANYIGDSIMQMMQGGSPISASIARHLLKRFDLHARHDPGDTDETGQCTSLSKQEVTVLRYLAKGFNCADIAGFLDISHHTVSTYIKRIYRKLAVHSRGEAVYEAHKMGIIEFD
ncbi:response regulator transcription factor [Thiohalobacter sp. IOR34]|uniref:response regulator transcription factor n=1 Tax=Thiohalobacter sp. IOR34 TaxID=3057176 RepID=UPI0025B00132|nr:response regulator transcription factor [Thiohalobacter sp. IOR34]WJW76446.1 response regulator transcription factor [Thiohalobacter sp. IOR34]